MTNVFIFNIFCIIAIVILVAIGICDTSSSYATKGMILTMFADIIGNTTLIYQSDIK